MKVLVIGGMHGNETLGIQLVASLIDNPIKGIDAIIANPNAVRASVRYTETDLNRSFGVQNPVSDEEKRACELDSIVDEYDIVLDFHNTQTPANNCCFVGVDCLPVLYDQAKQLGFDVVIEATYNCINKHHTNTLSIEISVDDAWDSVSYWRRRLERLGDGASIGKSIQLYRFDSRVTWQQFEQNRFRDWRPFVELNNNDTAVLGGSGRLAPIFVGSKFTPYYATLIRYIKQV